MESAVIFSGQIVVSSFVLVGLFAVFQTFISARLLFVDMEKSFSSVSCGDEPAKIFCSEPKLIRWIGVQRLAHKDWRTKIDAQRLAHKD